MKHLGQSLDTAISNFDAARRRKLQADAETLERLAKRAGLDAESAAKLAMNLAPLPKAKKEPFIMIQPTQNAAVIQWLLNYSKRPQAAVALWSQLFTAVHPSTGQILLSRKELADRLGIAPQNVSRIMTELASINAITRRKEGRRVIYSMNPNVGTHLPSPEAREEAREEAGPLLVLMEGGKA